MQSPVTLRGHQIQPPAAQTVAVRGNLHGLDMQCAGNLSYENVLITCQAQEHVHSKLPWQVCSASN